jgi:hypothetical protein
MDKTQRLHCCYPGSSPGGANNNIKVNLFPLLLIVDGGVVLFKNPYYLMVKCLFCNQEMGVRFPLWVGNKYKDIII